jgi:mono/diheme cytochrome c family protein
MAYRRTWALGAPVLCVALLGGMLGCNQSAAPTGGTGAAVAPVAAASPSNAPEPTGPFAAGKKVFMTQCARCHSEGGSGSMMVSGPPPDGKMKFGKMGGFGRGPNLSHVAADAKHTRQWLSEFILDPQAQKPPSRMPKFAGKINEQDLGAVVDYLLTLQ